MQIFGSFQEVYNANSGTGSLSGMSVFNSRFDKYGVTGEIVLGGYIGNPHGERQLFGIIDTGTEIRVGFTIGEQGRVSSRSFSGVNEAVQSLKEYANDRKETFTFGREHPRLSKDYRPSVAIAKELNEFGHNIQINEEMPQD